jgi:hypothetical protein
MFLSYYETTDEKYICIIRPSNCTIVIIRNLIKFTECNKWKDGKPINIYNLFTYVLFIITGMRNANLLVKTGLCHILSKCFGGALQRHGPAYCL